MHLFIKNMVSNRCKLIVKTELENINVAYTRLVLGEVVIMQTLTHVQRTSLKEALSKAGLELLENKKSMIIEKIKNIVVEMIHYDENLPKTKFSEYLSNKLNYDYTYLSNLFSEEKGTTIEQYIIINKIERVKELLDYDELTITEIAHKLHYSSVSHLSNQFKKNTGFSPSAFKKLKDKKLNTLESL